MSTGLRIQLEEAQSREKRRTDLKATGKNEQAMVEEIKRLDGVLEEERAINAGYLARMTQLETELDVQLDANQTKVEQLEALVRDLRDRLTSASMATSAVINKSKVGFGFAPPLPFKLFELTSDCKNMAFRTRIAPKLFIMQPDKNSSKSRPSWPQATCLTSRRLTFSRLRLKSSN